MLMKSPEECLNKASQLFNQSLEYFKDSGHLKGQIMAMEHSKKATSEKFENGILDVSSVLRQSVNFAEESLLNSEYEKYIKEVGIRKSCYIPR